MNSSVVVRRFAASPVLLRERMDHRGGGEKIRSELKKKILQIYLDFVARVQLLNEIAAVGNRFLIAFHQGLDVLSQPPINKTSNVVERVLQSSGSKRIISYVEAGCKTVHNTFMYTRNLHTCHLGLQDYLDKAKVIVDELECLVKEATSTIEAEYEGELQLSEQNAEVAVLEVTNDTEEIVSYDDDDDDKKPETTYYATTMSILHSMVKQDHTMKMRIISSLSLKTTSEELQTYTKLWQLQPFIDDDLMKQAFCLINV